MVQIVAIGMQSCLDLHPLWKKSFRRFSTWVLMATTLTSFFSTGMLVLLNKQKNHKLHKAPIQSIRVWLENLPQWSLLMSSNSHSNSSRFNHPTNQLARTRYKMFPMACLIRQTELCHLCLQEYLGVFRVPRSFIRLCKWVFVFFLRHYNKGSIIDQLFPKRVFSTSLSCN